MNLKISLARITALLSGGNLSNELRAQVLSL